MRAEVDGIGKVTVATRLSLAAARVVVEMGRGLAQSTAATAVVMVLKVQVVTHTFMHSVQLPCKAAAVRMPCER